MKRYFFVYFSCALLITSWQVLGQTCNPNIVKTKPDSQYTLSQDGTEVTDTKTGLIWQRCALGMSWDGTTCGGTATSHTWEDALAQAASVATNTSVAWRLPNKKELISLVETACVGQAINETLFPATPGVIWSSSTLNNFNNDANRSNFALYVYFTYDGMGGDTDKFDTLSVRLVRGE
jgi:hypothetical protein